MSYLTKNSENFLVFKSSHFNKRLLVKESDDFKIIANQDRQPSLREVQEYIKGYVEVLEGGRLPKGSCLLVNEEWSLKELDYNRVASILYWKTIVWNAIYISKENRETYKQSW